MKNKYSDNWKDSWNPEDWGTAIKLGKKLYGEDTIVHYS